MTIFIIGLIVLGLILMFGRCSSCLALVVIAGLGAYVLAAQIGRLIAALAHLAL